MATNEEWNAANVDLSRRQCHDAKAALIEALRDNLSPEAVAIIARRLTPTPASGYRELDAEVTWFATLLAETLGGWSQQERIIQELE